MATAKISDPELPLGKEYLVYSDFPLLMKTNSSQGIFMGHSRKGDSIGLSKYNFD
jgi:hypothetical protein